MVTAHKQAYPDSSIRFSASSIRKPWSISSTKKSVDIKFSFSLGPLKIAGDQAKLQITSKSDSSVSISTISGK